MTAGDFKLYSLCLAADVHSRFRTKRILQGAGAQIVLGLDDICTAPINGSGYNEKYGLLGSNKATDTKTKLFPRDGEEFVTAVQKGLREICGKQIEVLIYGDGAFKDPVGGIGNEVDPLWPRYPRSSRSSNEVVVFYG